MNGPLPSHWVQNKAFRSEALTMIRRCLREGWPLTPDQRDRLRVGLEDLLSSDEVRPRHACLAAKLLAELAT
jgi:hypothetical protein